MTRLLSSFRGGVFLCAALLCGCSAAGQADVVAASSAGASEQTMVTAAALGRGVNFGNILEAPREGDWGKPLQDADIDRVKQAGFQTIRLPVRWSNHASTTAPFAIDPIFAERVENVVDHALAAGLYVILDLHHYRQLNGEKLDPREADVDPDQLADRFVALWAQIAERFRNKSPKLLFEVMNEPNGQMTADKWNRLAARAIAEIRKTDKDRVLVVGPAHWNAASALQDLVLPNDPNLIVTVHNYDPFKFTHQGATWVTPLMPVGVACCSAAQIADIDAPLDIAAAWGKAHHYPIFLGEFGSNDKAEMSSRAAYTRAVRDAAEKRGISWAYWEYNSGFGVYNPRSNTWNEDLKNALLGR